jgi:hypothetical protein
MLAQLGAKMASDQLTGRQTTPVDLGDRIALLDKNGAVTGYLPKSRDAADWEMQKDADGNPTGRFNKRSGEFEPLNAGQPNQPKISREIAIREQEADRLGLAKDDPRRLTYVTTGQMPKPPDLGPADRKAILEAEDSATELGSTLADLKRARELAPLAYSGFGSGIGATLGTNLPGAVNPFDPKRAGATRELDQLMSEQSIASMSKALKGATTDTEMREFKRMMADPNLPTELKLRTIDRMLSKAQTQYELSQRRINEMRGGSYYKPAGQKTQQQGQNSSPLLDEARKAIANGADPEKVRARLKERGIDPGAL